MVAEIRRFEASADPSDIAAVLRSDGAAIVERLVTDELCDRFLAELAPHLESTRLGRNEFGGARTRRTYALPTRVPGSVELIANELVLEVLDAIRSPRSPSQLHLSQAICIGPGETAQMLHRDQWTLDSLELPERLEVELSTIWALTDFTEANGATRVALGMDAVADPDVQNLRPDQTIAAAMPRGSVVLYSPRTVHGGGANSSKANRIGVNVDYVRLVHPEVVGSEHPNADAPLPERLQRLVDHPVLGAAVGCLERAHR